MRKDHGKHQCSCFPFYFVSPNIIMNIVEEAVVLHYRLMIFRQNRWFSLCIVLDQVNFISKIRRKTFSCEMWLHIALWQNHILWSILMNSMNPWSNVGKDRDSSENLAGDVGFGEWGEGTNNIAGNQLVGIKIQESSFFFFKLSCF